MKRLHVPLIGRFGNLLFIYAHARAWCEQNGYELCVYPWVGEKVFTIPGARRPDASCEVWPERMYQDQPSLIYTRRQVREWFTFKPEILARLRVLDATEPEIILNVRQGHDYREAGLVTMSKESYVLACIKHGFDVAKARFETDLNPTLLPDFQGNMDASGLGVTWVGMPSFYRLMTAPVLFRANSSFSWWAATLGHGRVFSPIIRGLHGGVPDVRCDNFVEGNWPISADCGANTDLHLTP